MIPACLPLAQYFAFLFAPVPVVPWNQLEAEDEARGALLQRGQEPNNPFCKTPNCSVQHEILGEYELPYKTHKAHLIIGASKERQHTCPTCGAALSFLEFTVSRHVHEGDRGTGIPLWRVTHADFAVSEWGQRGEPFDKGITVDELGSDVPGIFVERRSTEKGRSQTTTDIYARLNAGFRLVASIPTGCDGPDAATVWRADIFVDSNPASFRDLIVQSSGTEAGTRLSKTERYRYNGSTYELAPGTPTPAAAPAVVRWDSVGTHHEVLRALEAQAKKPNDPICEIEATGYPGIAPEPGYKCSFQHQVLGDYDLPYALRRRKLVLAGSRDPIHSCDSCGVALSFFEFNPGQRGWELTHSDFGVGEWGHHGNPTLEPIAVATLGDDIPCVYAQRSQIQQGGIGDVSTDIYARLEAGFRVVGSIDASYSAISLDPRPAHTRPAG